MKKLLIALSAFLLLSGCATQFGTRLMPHKVKAHAVTHEAAPLPVPAPAAVTPVATPLPSHHLKWLH
jgi:hypothetical protein